MSDRIFGAFSFVIALLYVWQATIIQESFIQDPVGPKVFPFIIGGVLALSSVWFMLRPDDEPHWPEGAKLMEIAFAVAIMFAYAYTLTSVGFLVATAIASALLSWRLGAPPLSALIAGVCISGGIYVVFKLILGLSLAKGTLLASWGLV